MKTSSLIFYTFIVLSSVAYGGIVKNGEAWYRSMIYFAVDDRINDIYLNGNLVPISFGIIDTGLWATVKDFHLALFPGDEIRFDVENYDGVHTLDSFGFVATIHYVDQNGRGKIFTTNDSWTCDGAKPHLIKLLKDEKGISKIVWTHDKKLSQEGSYIIWGKASNSKTSCSFIIPRI